MPSLHAPPRIRFANLVAPAALILTLVACADAVAPSPDAAARRVTDGQSDWIVLLEDSVRDVGRAAAQLAAQHGGVVQREFTRAARGFAVRIPPAGAAALRGSSGVVAVEWDAPVTAAGTQEPVPSWGLDRVDQRTLPLDGRFTTARTGAGVNVYIVDSGIRSTHADLAGRVVAAWTAIEDGLGAEDCHGHGTRVAGIAAGTTYGIAKGATLFSVRVLDCALQGSTSQVIAALDWVVANHVPPAVINLSMSAPYSSIGNQAVARAVAAGIPVVMAAGNNGRQACGYSPGSEPSGLTVAATGSTDRRPSFSNYGSCVDLFAPGENVWTINAASDTATRSASGTSMATAHVTGVAALYLEANPAATPAAVASAILDGSTKGVVTNRGSGTPNRLLFSELAPPPALAIAAPRP